MSSIGNSSHHALGQVNLPPPFLSKTYDMVDDSHTNAIISWSPSNKSFVVWEPSVFSHFLLPHFFKHNNFSSFVRQLHTYGFRKVDPDRWEFANESFVKGQKHLLATIQRRYKAGPSNLQNMSASSNLPLTKNINVLHDELESLTKDKNSIMLEVVKLDHDHQATLQDVQSISNRLHAIELLQQQMVSLFAQTLNTTRKNDHPNLPTLEKRRKVDSLKIHDCCLPLSQKCIAKEKESLVIDGVKYLRVEDSMSPTPSKSMIQVDINDYEPTRVCAGKLYTKTQGPKCEVGKMLDAPSSQSNIDNNSRLTLTQGPQFEARKMLDLPSSQSNIDNSRLTSTRGPKFENIDYSRLTSDAIIVDDTSSQMGPLKSSKQELYLRAYECETNMNNHIFYSDTLYNEDMVCPNGFLWQY